MWHEGRFSKKRTSFGLPHALSMVAIMLVRTWLRSFSEAILASTARLSLSSKAVKEGMSVPVIACLIEAIGMPSSLMPRMASSSVSWLCEYCL